MKGKYIVERTPTSKRKGLRGEGCSFILGLEKINQRSHTAALVGELQSYLWRLAFLYLKLFLSLSATNPEDPTMAWPPRFSA